MNDNKKRWIRLLCFAFAALIPFLFAASALLFLPKAYGETFLGELAEKYRRLTDTDEPKIILIGGSSVAFGFDSAYMEEKTGYKVVNFGLYATLGTKMMLDLSEANINRGDIVVIAPELDEQTLSLYFNSSSAWQGLEGNLSMLSHIGSDNYGSLLAALPDYLGKRAGYAFSGEKLSPSGIYRRDSFNEYGDISYPREYNVMTFSYDKSQTIRLEEDIVDPEYLVYLNEYIDRASHAGAEVYFTFCPMNAMAMAENTTDASIEAFYGFLNDNLRCRVISDPRDAIMDAGYFYDTNYHLNDAGVRVHTSLVTADILRTLGKTDQAILELPEPPGKKPEDTIGPGGEYTEDPNEKYFIYEDFGGALRIIGVTSEARYMTSVELPATAEGKKVLVVGPSAFKGCEALSEVIIGDSYTLIEDGAFADCPTIRRIVMNRENSDSLEASPDVFKNAPDSLKIYFLTQSSFATFSAGYWWGLHAARMVKP
ncbi:MAG: leucine-rich repeat domain-containing protein [Clostridia bacterium]|nr:leucine-rich repeat domain-containing protein [Clostridia bacterium]